MSGDETSFEERCKAYHDGSAWPDTAADLMRARYAAFETGNIAFLSESQHPDHREEVDEEALKAWSSQSEWKGFEVLATEAGGPDDTEGVVEFVAHYSIQGQDQAHHEIAQFEKHDDRWYFVDGQTVGAGTFVREEPKVGRNDPCPCGSGKKYKKCHGAA